MKRKDTESSEYSRGQRTVGTKPAEKSDWPPTVKPPSEKNSVSFWSRKALRPTYEIVGDLERFDERDSIFARAALVPGTETYGAYYGAHPEREERDRLIRIFQNPVDEAKQRDGIFARDPVALAFSNTFRTAHFLGDRVDGPVRETRVEADPVSMSKTIKGAARFLGADMVGISQLNPAWVYSHKGRGLFGGVQWGDPIEHNHQYAIVMGFAHTWDMLRAGREPSLSAGIESHEIYGVMATAAVRLASFIRALGYPARAHHTGNYQVLLVPNAIDAGMGELGRLGFLVTKEFGPSLRLVAVTTDLSLAVDQPLDIGVQDFCEKCLKCARICPTNAIPVEKKTVTRGVLKWQIEANRCYRFWHVRGGASCNACMCVCPWTKPRNTFHRINAEIASRSSIARSLLNWADDLFYGKRPKRDPYPDWLRWDDKRP